MRIDQLTVSNYKGIRSMDVGDLAVLPVITISGKNGAGKSLLLEALAMTWARRVFSPVSMIGPWADEVVVRFTVVLSDEEWDQVDAFRGHQSPGHAPLDRVPVEVKLLYNVTGAGSISSSHPAFDVLRNEAFTQSHNFASIDFMPALRYMPLGQQTAVDPLMLGADRVRQEQTNLLDSYLRSRSQLQLASVKSFLATIDYVDFLRQRESGQAGDEYERLVEAFSRATGKSVNRPVADPRTGSRILVETPAGIKHDIDELSTGEQEVLSLMYFIRRLNARGGVLLLDEPELHLHPTLQPLLFSVVEDISGRAQVWLVSHSPRLITSAPLAGILSMEPASAEPFNQVRRATEESARADLLEELGIRAIDLFQHDAIIVVEGPTDAEWIREIFPVEAGRSSIHTVGGAEGVEAAYDALAASDLPLPWMCVRDRDLLEDDEVAALLEARPAMFVWERRSLENCLLEGGLIARVFSDAGTAISAENAETTMFSLATELQDEVLAETFKAELSRSVRVESQTQSLGRIDRQRAYLEQGIRVNQSRLANFDAVLAAANAKLEARWATDWKELVQGKELLKTLLPRSPFRHHTNLSNAVARVCREVPTLRPAPVNTLHRRLLTLLGIRAEVEA